MPLTQWNVHLPVKVSLSLSILFKAKFVKILDCKGVGKTTVWFCVAPTFCRQRAVTFFQSVHKRPHVQICLAYESIQCCLLMFWQNMEAPNVLGVSAFLLLWHISDPDQQTVAIRSFILYNGLSFSGSPVRIPTNNCWSRHGRFMDSLLTSDGW